MVRVETGAGLGRDALLRARPPPPAVPAGARALDAACRAGGAAAGPDLPSRVRAFADPAFAAA